MSFEEFKEKIYSIITKYHLSEDDSEYDFIDESDDDTIDLFMYFEGHGEGEYSPANLWSPEEYPEFIPDKNVEDKEVAASEINNFVSRFGFYPKFEYEDYMTAERFTLKITREEYNKEMEEK